MSKYGKLWEYLKEKQKESYLLSYQQIKEILGFDINHSFLNAKKEAAEYGYEVGKISLKKQTIAFHKIK